MQCIWKFELQWTDEQVLSLPTGAQLLTVQLQRRKACLWVLFDARFVENREPRTIVMCGTGNPIDRPPGDYIGTVQIDEFVWHFFDRGSGRAAEGG